MARAMVAGSTDYSHQSLDDMINDLEEWKRSLTKVLEMLTTSTSQLQENEYWKEKVNLNLGPIFAYSIKFFATSLTEINDILVEVRSEIEPNHISRLKNLAKTARELNRDIGRIWHNDFLDKDYGEKNFNLLERMYSEARGMAVDMIDLSNLSARLEDFVGKKDSSLKQFNLDLIKSALWVLEGDESQGTAFALSTVGLVTCQHVLGPNMYAFKSDTPTQKYEVNVLKQNPTIDLAILQINTSLTGELVAGNVDNVKQMDQIAVVGYPNYRYGDTGVIHLGLISGFRPVSTIRRMLVDVPIVAGNSGGPVLNLDHHVIGVAVTGADRMENANNTENHGVIPIDALQYLLID